MDYLLLGDILKVMAVFFLLHLAMDHAKRQYYYAKRQYKIGLREGRYDY